MRNANPLNIRTIDHVVIRVRSLERMVEFYCDVLGCRLERGPGTKGLAQLRAGDSLIDLIDCQSPLARETGSEPHAAMGNMDHVCFRIEPWDLESLESHLDRAGVVVDLRGERYGAAGTGPSIYIRDPEGNSLELKGPASRRSGVSNANPEALA
jgi:catechol 2,3-dioxygenase-like lactoylglutathione lyase family enzyme